MTDRSLTTAVKTETEAGAVRAAIFGELDFASGTNYAWTGVREYTVAMPGEAAQTWSPVGDMVSIGPVPEGPSTSLRIALSGVDSTVLSESLNENYQNRTVKLWFALLNDDDTIMADPVLIFAGPMDVMTVNEGDGTGTIELDVTSGSAMLQRRSLSLLTDEEQQRLHPGDKFLEYVAELASKGIVLGVPASEPAKKVGSPSGDTQFARFPGFQHDIF